MLTYRGGQCNHLLAAVHQKKALQNKVLSCLPEGDERNGIINQQKPLMLLLSFCIASCPGYRGGSEEKWPVYEANIVPQFLLSLV